MAINGALFPLRTRKPQPPTPAEIARRAEAIARESAREIHNRAVTGAAHQDETPPALEPPALEPASERHGGRGSDIFDPRSDKACLELQPRPCGDPAPSAAAPRPLDDRVRRLTLDGAPPDCWVSAEHGVRRWHPVVDELDVSALPGGGLMLAGSGLRTHRFDAAMRRHLAWLAMPDEWREILEQAGVQR